MGRGGRLVAGPLVGLKPAGWKEGRKGGKNRERELLSPVNLTLPFSCQPGSCRSCCCGQTRPASQPAGVPNGGHALKPGERKREGFCRTWGLQPRPCDGCILSFTLPGACVCIDVHVLFSVALYSLSLSLPLSLSVLVYCYLSVGPSICMSMCVYMYIYMIIYVYIFVYAYIYIHTHFYLFQCLCVVTWYIMQTRTHARTQTHAKQTGFEVWVSTCFSYSGARILQRCTECVSD